MKRLLTILLCLSMLLSAVPALADEEPIVIKFAYNAFDAAITAWTNCIDAANRVLKEQNKNIVIEGVQVPVSDWNEYYTKITTQIAGGTGPDIGLIAESFMPMAIKQGVALDISEYMDRINMEEYFEATFYNAAYQDGKFYGLPGSIYYLLTYYNKDLFTEKGVAIPSLDWNNAMTFQDVLDISSKIAGGEGARKLYGFNNMPYMAFVGMYALSNGGVNVFDEEGKVALTTPEGLEVYKWFDDLMCNGYMPRPSDTQVISAFDMFCNGRVGMIVDGSWSLTSLFDYDELNIGIAPVPSGKGNSYSAMYVDSFVVYKGTQNKEAAFDALNAMISYEGWSALAETAFGGVPLHRKAFEDNKESFLPMGMDETDLKVFIEGMDHAVKVPYNEFYEQADYEANLAMEEWLLDMISYEEYAKKVEGIVEKYQAESLAGK